MVKEAKSYRNMCDHAINVHGIKREPNETFQDYEDNEIKTLLKNKYLA